MKHTEGKPCAQQQQKQHQQSQQLSVCGVPLKTVVKTALLAATFVAATLLPSRDWAWAAPWFAGGAMTLLVLLPCGYYIGTFNPDLIPERERFTSNPGTADFEMILVPAVVWSMPLRYIAAGLQHWQDMLQPGWSPTPLLSTPTMQLAAAAIVLSCLLETWAVCSNKYFSSVVRLQTDRGHKVCSHGPYAIVRHPGYVAFSLHAIGEAALMQSSWSMAFAVAMTLLLVIRTGREDAFLQKSLEGYAAYTRQVRYRLVPLLW